MSIALQDISYSVGGTAVLTGINAEFARGKLTCLLGPNGAGKTTLLRCITGELTPANGNVTVGSASTDDELRNIVAFAPQSHTTPDDLTVAEMLELGRFDPRKAWFSSITEDDRRLIDESIALTGIAHLTNRRVTTLSGGEMQRTWIAFCMAQHKPYLLFDESLSAIDFIARRAYFTLLKSVAHQNRGVVLVTHDLAMVNEFADSVLVLDRGVVRYEGPTGDEFDHSIGQLSGSVV